MGHNKGAKGARQPRPVQQFGHGGQIVALAAGQGKGERQSVRVGADVELGREAAARAPERDGCALLSPFLRLAPAACDYERRGSRSRQRLSEPASPQPSSCRRGASQRRLCVAATARQAWARGARSAGGLGAIEQREDGYHVSPGGPAANLVTGIRPGPYRDLYEAMDAIAFATGGACEKSQS